jgi:anthranilate phosphoribosyltransferase
LIRFAGIDARFPERLHYEIFAHAGESSAAPAPAQIGPAEMITVAAACFFRPPPLPPKVHPVLDQLTTRLRAHHSLRAEEISAAVAELTSESIPAEGKADFLTALAQKGETADEILGFARLLRDRAIQPELSPATRAGVILDVCGTGGDHLHTFNISSTVSILVAAAGIAVAKHGNRAITSRAGSADVLEALGIPVELDPPAAARWLDRHGFAFFFAPRYHPAFKHIAPARKLCSARGQRTLFNFLGPLLNPARPTAQLIGVPRPPWCAPLAVALQQLGARRGLVVSGRVHDAWLDELSPLGQTHCAEFIGGEPVKEFQHPAALLPLRPCSLEDLRGGEAAENAATLRRILADEERGPKRDVVLLNAAAALRVAGRAAGWREGWELAAELIDSGRARAKLEELIEAGRAESRPA